MTRRVPVAIALIVLIAGVVHVATQPRPLKVLVLYDMEGVSGASDYRHTTFYPPEYAQGRKSLTADVNAAIAGLAAGGARSWSWTGTGRGTPGTPDVFEGPADGAGEDDLATRRVRHLHGQLRPVD